MTKIKFIFKRLVFALLTLWAVATLTFVLMHNIPGDPFTAKKAISPQILNNLKLKYGLDKPLLSQYVVYMGNLLKLDLGTSMVYKNRSVNSIIAQSFPLSVDLGLRALIIAVVVGFTLGIFAALYYRKFLDYMSLMVAIIGVSIPGYIFGTLIQYFLCFKLSNLIQAWLGTDYRLLPITGWEGFRYTIAPSIALSIGAVGIIIRMTRASMLDEINKNYVVGARAKGLDEREIITKHVIKNALIPVVSVIGPILTAIIMGSFVIENIFSIPGLGKYFITSIQSKDYTMVLGLSIFTAFIVIVINTLIDILYAALDPRMKL